MRYAIMFMLEEYPTFFHIDLPEGKTIDLHIQQMATLIIKNPNPEMSVKDRGSFLDPERYIAHSTEQILEWLDRVLADPVKLEVKTALVPSKGGDLYSRIRDQKECGELGFHNCAVCGDGVELWAYNDLKSDVRTYSLMCTREGKFGPQDSLIGSGCVLYMPPHEFYCATAREAGVYWNEWSAAINDLRSLTRIENIPDNAIERVESYMNRHSPLTQRKLKETLEKLREINEGEEPQIEQYFSAVVGMAMLKAYVAGMEEAHAVKPTTDIPKDVL